MAGKMGRPTNNPKGKSVHVRLDVISETILDEYATKNGVSRAEAIRRGILLLKDDKK